MTQPRLLLVLLAAVFVLCGCGLFAADAPPPPSLMLEQPVNTLPAVGGFAWNAWANSSSWAALVVWGAMLYALLLLGLPLALLVFARWRTAGVAWARTLALLVVGYAVWLPCSLGWWLFSPASIAAGVGLLLVLDALLVARMGGLRGVLARLRPHRRHIVVSEALFLGGFLAFAAVRAYNPDLWHPIWGGEKPMEFAFLNALVRTPTIPPYDPFFSDGSINYYYYGLYLMSLLIRATGIAPAIAFNLIIPMLFALTLTGGYAVVAHLTGRVRYGLVGAAFLAVLGNLAAVIPVGWSQGYRPIRAIFTAPGSESLLERLSLLGRRLGDWYIGPSRVITEPFFTINEFPFWGFLFADLHPHILALPVALLVIALLYRVIESFGRWWQPGLPATLLLLALGLGTLAVTNSWDFPTYALLVGGALVGGAWRTARTPLPVVRLEGAALLAVLLAGGGLALYAPFFSHYHAFVSGVGQVQESIPLRGYVVIHGLFLVILLPVLVGAAWKLTRAAPIRTCPRTHTRAPAPRPAPRGRGRDIGTALAVAPMLVLLLAPLANAARQLLTTVRGPRRLVSLVAVLVNGVSLLLMLVGVVAARRVLRPALPITSVTPATPATPAPRAVPRPATTTMRRAGLLVFLAVAVVLVATMPWQAVRLWSAAMVLLGGSVLLSRRLSPAVWYTLLLATLGWCVTLGIDLFYIRDHLDHGEWYRMNTVFKFGMQLWTLFALAAAASVPLLMRGLRRIGRVAARFVSSPATPPAVLHRRQRTGGIIVQGVGLLLLAPLVLAAAMFPLVGTPSRVANRFAAAPGPTLDGLAFLRSATFTHNGKMIDLAPDWEAIQWLNQHMIGTPVVLQAGIGYYREYGIRVAANTGLPTVMSPLHEYEQREPGQVSRRENDVRTIYHTTSTDTALHLLKTYHVNYVYIGSVERAFYPADGLQKFATSLAPHLRPVYQTPGVQIYRVEAVPLHYPEPEVFVSDEDISRPTMDMEDDVSPPGENGDVPSGLQALERQVADDPTNAPLVFDLAQRYRALDRYEDAERILSVAAPANPNDTGLYHLWGDVLAHLEHYDEAEEVYTFAATNNPTSFNWYKLGHELLSWGELDKAEIALVRALTIEPVEPATYYDMGEVAYQRDNHEEAAKYMRLYLQVEPDGAYSQAAKTRLEMLNNGN